MVTFNQQVYIMWLVRELLFLREDRCEYEPPLNSVYKNLVAFIEEKQYNKSIQLSKAVDTHEEKVVGSRQFQTRCTRIWYFEGCSFSKRKEDKTIHI